MGSCTSSHVSVPIPACHRGTVIKSSISKSSSSKSNYHKAPVDSKSVSNCNGADSVKVAKFSQVQNLATCSALKSPLTQSVNTYQVEQDGVLYNVPQLGAVDQSTILARRRAPKKAFT